MFNFLKKKENKIITTEEQRKNSSIQILKDNDIPYIDHLPPLIEDTEAKVRTADEIGRRAITCLLVIQYAFDQSKQSDNLEQSKKFFTGVLKNFEVLDNLTENEQIVMNDEASGQDLVNLMWKYEGYWVLVWALGLVDELSIPVDIVNGMKAVSFIKDCNDYEDFISKCNLRTIEEILDEADLHYRYHWAAVDARINNKECKLNGDVTVERLRAFNWLIDLDENDDWDNPPSDT